ncbi:MAG: hypothetical protein K8S14_05235 [Actinomycetia bacterium]|nr:hypothetical protein [Actinomycetes bacterium]
MLTLKAKKTKMELLIIGTADSIFFEHYTKNLKIQNPNINIDIFSLTAIKGNHDLSACDTICSSKWENLIYSRIRGIRVILYPIHTWLSLIAFLINNKKKYDIIHFKWVVPSIVIFPSLITSYSKKSVATFWGAEFENLGLFYSKTIYRMLLKHFLRKISIITYATNEGYQEIFKLCHNNDKLKYAIYGSSVAGVQEQLVTYETKRKSKEILLMNFRKITISIAYSGKEVHRHIPIINMLFSDDNFTKSKDNFTFILPMTYGCELGYIKNVENLLKSYGADYKVFTQKMTDLEVARLRNATDIMIQLTTSDGRSASIIESLLSGAILISGKWLPYEVFRDKSLYFYELDNIDASLPELILKLSLNIDDELKKCQENKFKLGFETWDRVINSWIDIYDKLLMMESN